MLTTKDEVVVLVMAYRNTLSDFEAISLRQCFKILGNHPIRIVKPRSIDLAGWQVDTSLADAEDFDESYFKDIGAYSRLLLSTDFYKRFRRYKYMLIYQLDAFVFKDDLLKWCQMDFDYIGAPWFENFSHVNKRANFIKGGNGGFSLRKIESHLKVLKSFSYINRPAENWRIRVETRPSGKSIIGQAAGFFLDLTVRNNTFALLNSFKGYEDQFWCLVAARNFSWYQIPDHHIEMKFAMEMQPERVFKLNERQLPFGCHAWWKYDLPFWKPYIEHFGHRLEHSTVTTSGN